MKGKVCGQALNKLKMSENRVRETMINQEKIKEGVRLILEGIGEDLNREGLRETPDRIARMYEEVFSGMEELPGQHLAKRFPVEDDHIILEKDITFFSMCEHHLLPFFGKVHLAYLPKGEVAAGPSGRGFCQKAPASGKNVCPDCRCSDGVS